MQGMMRALQSPKIPQRQQLDKRLGITTTFDESFIAASPSNLSAGKDFHEDT